MNLGDLKIGHRVALAFGLVVVTILAMAAVISAALARTAASAADASAGVERQQMSAQTLVLAKDNAIASMMVLVSSSADQQKRLQGEMAGRDQAIANNLKALEESSAGTETAAALVAEARKRQATYRAGVKRIVDMVLAGKQAEAAFAADEEMIPMLAPFLAALEKLNAVEAGRLKQIEQANEQLIESTQWITGAAALGATVLAAVAGMLVVRSITRPLAQALAVAERVAAGDLSANVVKQGKDELSQLLHALNRMTSNLSGLVSRVRDVADGVATGAAQIASGNSDLSHRTEQQASTLQQTAASMEELGSTVSQNSESARQADRLAREASTVAVHGGHVVGQVIDTMRHIDHSSKKIADIIGVIDSIAFQTNILALNAAVEAARAGEQGRGFAVVASEVRSLAQRSANAAREIKGLIDTSVQQVQEGTALVDRAGSTMQEVVTAIGRVSNIITEVSNAGREQSSGVAQVGQAVSQMDTSTQQNAALVEQSAAAAESLRLQAEQLVQSVAAFKLA